MYFLSFFIYQIILYNLLFNLPTIFFMGLFLSAEVYLVFHFGSVSLSVSESSSFKAVDLR